MKLKPGKIITAVVIAIVSLVSLVPFWFMFSMSTYKSELIFQGVPIFPSNFLGENLKTIFSVPILASIVGVSEGHLRRLFKQELETNVVDYITDYRVDMAQKLLADPTVEFSEIWKKTGFSSSQYFGVVFKKKTGVLPKDYMRAKRGVRG